jgi:hypothetical protein
MATYKRGKELCIYAETVFSKYLRFLDKMNAEQYMELYRLDLDLDIALSKIELFLHREELDSKSGEQ